MKISIGANIFNGPWGGGNLFFKNFVSHFRSNGHDVINNLAENDIDIILLTDPRKESESSSFTHKDISKYLKYINPNTVVVHRINECDERKSTNGVNSFYVNANKVAHYTVFVSSWIRDIYKYFGMNVEKSKVILGGGDSNVFNQNDKPIWNGNEKLKIVTHHWSSNENKGFEIYQELDYLLGNELLELVEFTYIGNLPNSVNLKNTKIIKPIHGKNLSDELKKHHVYITASKNEPSGNHHIEAAQCGLPILYLDSGGIPEYCQGFGISYKKETLIEKIDEISKNYNHYFKELKKYPFSNNQLHSEYEDLFEKLIKNHKTESNTKNFYFFHFFVNAQLQLKKLLNLSRNL